MFWTNIVKSLIKTFSVVSIIAIAILGFYLMSLDDDLIVTGILIIIIGSAIVLVSVSLLGVFTEISENLYEINRKTNTMPQPLNNTQSPNNTYKPQNSKPNLSTIASSSPSGNTWKCPKCGKTNSTSSRVCMDCSYQK